MKAMALLLAGGVMAAGVTVSSSTPQTDPNTVDCDMVITSLAEMSDGMRRQVHTIQDVADVDYFHEYVTQECREG